MPRHRVMVEGDGGWTEWVHPLPGYRMSCCDCGLVHELEFDVVDGGKVIFRARRSNRATAAVRRERAKRGAADAEA